MVLSAVENLWQPYLADIIKDSGYGTEVFGILSALYFLMATCSSLFSVRLLRWLKGSHRKLLFVSYIAAGTILVLLAFSASLLTFAAGYLLFFFLFTLGGNSQSVLLNDHTQAQYRSTMLSISSLVVTVGGVVASVSFGYIADLYGIAVSWWLGALLLLLSSLLFLRIPEIEISEPSSKGLA
jgi:predicted MFS family arabinose efflux permease